LIIASACRIAGRIGTAPSANFSLALRVHDMVTLAAPGTLLPAPRTLTAPPPDEVFQCCVWPPPGVTVIPPLLTERTSMTTSPGALARVSDAVVALPLSDTKAPHGVI
jgi:hypothetical protein